MIIFFIFLKKFIKFFKKNKHNTRHNRYYKKNNNESFFEFIKNEYSEAYKIVQKVSEYLHKQYKYEVNNDEIIYLTIHVQRLIKTNL